MIGAKKHLIAMGGAGDAPPSGGPLRRLNPTINNIIDTNSLNSAFDIMTPTGVNRVLVVYVVCEKPSLPSYASFTFNATFAGLTASASYRTTARGKGAAYFVFDEGQIAEAANLTVQVTNSTSDGGKIRWSSGYWLFENASNLVDATASYSTASKTKYVTEDQAISTIFASNYGSWSFYNLDHKYTQNDSKIGNNIDEATGLVNLPLSGPSVNVGANASTGDYTTGMVSASVSPYVPPLAGNDLVYAVGQNSYGQVLGNGAVFTPIMTPFTTINDIKQLACGTGYTMAVKNDGTLWGVGYNTYGQVLGNGSIAVVNTWTQLESGVKEVICGYYCTFVLYENGELWGSGYNKQGQITGDGSTSSVTRRILLDTNVRHAALGQKHSIVVYNDGSCKGSGSNTYRSILDTSTSSYTTRVLVESGGVAKVACGYDTTVLLMENGDVKAFGQNSYGQVRGNGTTTTTQGAHIVIESGVADIATGNTHTVLLMENGDVKAFGLNNQGQVLGNGSTTATVATSTVIETGVAQIYANSSSTYLLMENGDLKAFGYNGYGELFTGDTTSPKATSSVVATGVSKLPTNSFKNTGSGYYIK